MTSLEHKAIDRDEDPIVEPISHEPGIYFGMPAHEYHADPALGSSNVRQLRRNPASYWFESWMNPSRPPERDSISKLRGRAMQTRVYEGEQAFDARYCRGPDQDPDATPAEKAAITKAHNVKARARGLATIPAEDYDRIGIAAAMITKNPKLSTVFSGGMSEVSIFYLANIDDEIVKCKARIDYLKLRGIGDLKGIANPFDDEFKQACRLAITRYRYDIQAQYYLTARSLIPALVSAGAVHGDHDPEWLRKLCAETRYGWQWIFHQTECAPITWSYILSPSNPICEVAQRHIDVALQAFVTYRRRFGLTMWLLIETPQELALEEMPSWFAR